MQIHVPYHQLLRSTGIQMGLALQLFPYIGIVLGKCSEYLNYPYMFYVGNDLHDEDANIPPLVRCLKDLREGMVARGLDPEKFRRHFQGEAIIAPKEINAAIWRFCEYHEAVYCEFQLSREELVMLREAYGPSDPRVDQIYTKRFLAGLMAVKSASCMYRVWDYKWRPGKEFRSENLWEKLALWTTRINHYVQLNICRILAVALYVLAVSGVFLIHEDNVYEEGRAFLDIILTIAALYVSFFFKKLQINPKWYDGTMCL